MFSSGFFLFITLFAVQFSPLQAADSTEIFLLCKRDKSIRWLRAYKLDSGKCKTHYSKEGYLQVVSSATFFASCEGVLQSVRKNIEEGGFKCADVTSVIVAELE